MSDRDAIIETINLYALALDSQCWDLFERVFTTDVSADYGVGMHWQGLAEFTRDFADFHALFDATQHVMTNHLVRVDADRASAHTYGAWRLVRYAAGDPPVWDGTGYYDDELVRTPDGWRIAKRVCRVVYWTGNRRVQSPSEDFQFQLDVVSLKGEAEAGRLNILTALA